MIRRYIYILTGITVVVVFLMAFLHFNSEKAKIKKNGFKRTELTTGVVKLHTVSFKEQIVDVAGLESDKLYLATKEPGSILITDTGFGNIVPFQLKLEVSNKLRSNFTTTLIDNTLYIAGANVPGIIRYDLSTNMAHTYNIDRTFSRCAIINDHSAILRGFNASFDDELFRKMDMPSASYIEENGITDKTAGGGFVTDGMLHYDAKTGRLVYNFFYCNRLLFLDTNLNLLQTGSTIDTFRTYTASAKAIKTSQGVSFAFSKPPELLSLLSCVEDGKLFIYSRLKADNEDMDVFRNNTIIDVYDIASGTYEGSMYVPLENGQRMLRFKIFGNRLFAIYTDAVVTYQIPAHI